MTNRLVWCQLWHSKQGEALYGYSLHKTQAECEQFCLEEYQTTLATTELHPTLTDILVPFEEPYLCRLTESEYQDTFSSTNTIGTIVRSEHTPVRTLGPHHLALN